MSTRTYPLRTRTDAGVAAQLRVSTKVVPLPVQGNTSIQDPALHLAGSIDTTDTVSALYSDIAVSRPPSPRREIPIPSMTRLVPPNVVKVEPLRLLKDGTSINNSNNKNKKVDKLPTLSEMSMPSESEEGTSWTTVWHRHAQSLGSMDKGQKDGAKVNFKAELTKEQNQVVNAATDNLTDEQKLQIRRRNKKIVNRREGSVSSRGEGPPNRKERPLIPVNGAM